MLSHSEIKSLANLLKVEDPESSSDDDLPKTGYASMGPGDIKTKTNIKIKGNEVESKSEDEIKLDPKSIWTLDEVNEAPSCDDTLWDPRETPKYDIIYKQAVRSEDIFLQMTNKTPTTASCECMVITIPMDDDKDKIDCNITKTTLDIRSPKYRLNLPLLHPVDPNLCTAEWHTSSSKLVVNLYLKREFDCVNF